MLSLDVMQGFAGFIQEVYFWRSAPVTTLKAGSGERKMKQHETLESHGETVRWTIYSLDPCHRIECGVSLHVLTHVLYMNLICIKAHKCRGRCTDFPPNIHEGVTVHVDVSTVHFLLRGQTSYTSILQWKNNK